MKLLLSNEDNQQFVKDYLDDSNELWPQFELKEDWRLDARASWKAKKVNMNSRQTRITWGMGKYQL